MAELDEYGRPIPGDEPPVSGATVGADAAGAEAASPSAGGYENTTRAEPDPQYSGHREDNPPVAPERSGPSALDAFGQVAEKVSGAAEGHDAARGKSPDERVTDAENAHDKLDLFGEWVRDADPKGKEREGNSLTGEWQDLQRRIAEYVDRNAYDANLEGSLRGEQADIIRRHDAWLEQMKWLDAAGGAYNDAALGAKRADSALDQWQQAVAQDDAALDQNQTEPFNATAGQWDLQQQRALSDYDTAQNTEASQPGVPEADPLGPAAPGHFTTPSGQEVVQVIDQDGGYSHWSIPGAENPDNVLYHDGQNWRAVSRTEAQQLIAEGAKPAQFTSVSNADSIAGAAYQSTGSQPTPGRVIQAGIMALGAAALLPAAGGAGLAGTAGNALARQVATETLARTGLLAGVEDVVGTTNALAQVASAISRPIEVALRVGSGGLAGYQGIEGAKTIKRGDVLGGSLEILGGAMTLGFGFGLGASARSALAGTDALGIVPGFAQGGSGVLPLFKLEGASFAGKVGRIGLAALIEGVPGIVPYAPDASRHPAGYLIDNIERAVRTGIESPDVFWSKVYELATRNVQVGDLRAVVDSLFHQDDATFQRQQGLQRTAQELDPFVGAPARWQLAGAVGSVLLSHMTAQMRGDSTLSYLDPFQHFSTTYQQFLDAGQSPEEALDSTIKKTSNGFAYFLFTMNPRNPAYTWLGMPALEHVVGNALTGMGRKSLNLQGLLNGSASLADRRRGPVEAAVGLSKTSAIGQLDKELFRNFNSLIPPGDHSIPAFGQITRAAEQYALAGMAHQRGDPTAAAVYEQIGKTYARQLERELNAPSTGSWEFALRSMADSARLRMEFGGGKVDPGDYFGRMRGAYENRMRGTAKTPEAVSRDEAAIARVQREHGGNLSNEAAARLTGIENLTGLVRDTFRMQAGLPIMAAAENPALVKRAILAGLDGTRTIMLALSAHMLAIQKGGSEQLNVMAAGGEGASLADSATMLRRYKGDPARYDRSVQGQFAQHGAAVPDYLLLPEKATGAGVYGKMKAALDNYIENIVGATTQHARAGAARVATDELAIQRQAHLEALETSLRHAGLAEPRIQGILSRIADAPRPVAYNEAAAILKQETKLPGYAPAPITRAPMASPLAPVHTPPTGMRGIWERMRMLPAVEPRYRPHDVPEPHEVRAAFRSPERVPTRFDAKAALLRERTQELADLLKGLNGDERKAAIHEFNRQNAYHGIDLPVPGYDTPMNIRQGMMARGEPVADTFAQLVQERTQRPPIDVRGGKPEDRARLVAMADRLLAARDAKQRVGENLQAARDEAAHRFAAGRNAPVDRELTTKERNRLTPAQRDQLAQLRQADMRLQAHREQVPVTAEGVKKYTEAAALAHIPTREHLGEDLMAHAERVKRLVDDPMAKPRWEQTILERAQALHAKDNPGIVSPFARPGPVAQAPGLPPLPQHEDLATAATVLESFGRQRQQLERAGLMRADWLNDRAVGDFTKKSALGEMATYVYPFLDFHLNQKRIAATNIARNPLYGAAMLRYLNDNQDELGRLPVVGPYVANLEKLYTGLQAMKWGKDLYGYADDVINDETNSPVQKAVKIAARPLVGPGALAHMFPFADVPLQGAVSAVTNPVKSDTNYTNNTNWATSGLRYLADRAVGENNPALRDRLRTAARWAGNPVGTTFDEAGRHVMGRLGIPTKEHDEFGPDWNHAIPEIGRSLGWDRNRMQAAIDAEHLPRYEGEVDGSYAARQAAARQDLATLKQAYLRKTDLEGLSTIIPTPLSRPRGTGEAGIYPKAGVATPFDADSEQSFQQRRLAGASRPPGLGGLYLQKDAYARNTGLTSPESLRATGQLVDALRRPDVGFPANNKLTEHQTEVRSTNAAKNPSRAAAIEEGYGLGPYFDDRASATQRDVLLYEDAHQDVRKQLRDAGYNDAVAAGAFSRATEIAASVPGGREYEEGLRKLRQAGGDHLAIARDDYAMHHPEGGIAGHVPTFDQTFRDSLADPPTAALLTENKNRREDMLAAHPEYQAVLDGLRTLPEHETAAHYIDQHREAFDALAGLTAELNNRGLGLAQFRRDERAAALGMVDPNTPAYQARSFTYNDADAPTGKALVDRGNLRAGLFRDHPEWRGQYYNEYVTLATPEEKHAYKLSHPGLFAALDGIDARIAQDDAINPNLALHRLGQSLAAKGFMDPKAALLQKDNVYFDVFTDSERKAFDGYEAVVKSDVAQRWFELAKRFNGTAEEGGLGGYSTPAGKAWFLEHRGEYNKAKDDYHAGLRDILTKTGSDPLTAANRIKVAEGQAPLSTSSVDDLVDSKPGATFTARAPRSGKGHGDGLTGEQRLEVARQRGLAAYQDRTRWQHDALATFGEPTGRTGLSPALESVHDINKHTPEADFRAYYDSLTSWEKKQVIQAGGKPEKGADAALFEKALADARAITSQPNLYAHGQKGKEGGIPGGLTGNHTALDAFGQAVSSDPNAPFSATGVGGATGAAGKAVYGSLDQYGQTVRAAGSRSHGGSSKPKPRAGKPYHAPKIPKPKGKFTKKKVTIKKK